MTTTGQGRGAVRDGACVAMLALVGGAGSVGCAGSTTTTVDPYDQAYVVTGYDPADLAYSTYDWADDWNDSTLYECGDAKRNGASASLPPCAQ